jgi:hypothetical protein
MTKASTALRRVRCEGWRRHGGAFTLGPVTWEQCKNDGIVTLKFKDADTGKVKTLPACKECWAECLENGIKIIEERGSASCGSIPQISPQGNPRN